MGHQEGKFISKFHPNFAILKPKKIFHLGGILTEALSKASDAVVLFDEIGKFYS